MALAPSWRARKTAYSATTVLPLEVGVLTSTPIPASSFSAASTWKASIGHGSVAWKASTGLVVRTSPAYPGSAGGQLLGVDRWRVLARDLTGLLHHLDALVDCHQGRGLHALDR